VNFGSGYDFATLGHILHNESGTSAIAEWLVHDDRTKPVPSLIFSVQMRVKSEKGATFSFNEIKSWLENAGFKKVRRLEAPGPSP
jgi:hypothetical protein